MNYLYPIVAAALLMLPAIAYAQSTPPDDPGIAPPPPDTALKQHGDGGMIVRPPQTDPKSIAKPPRHLDPGIDDATGKIDRKKLRGKPKPRTRDVQGTVPAPS